MKWGDSKTMRFIRLYHMHPCLWDTSSRDYNIRTKREEALSAILAKMKIPNFTHAACKIKIKNMRSQYCHELKRIKLSVKNGGRVHKPTLAWFNTMDKFLRPIVVQRTKNVPDEKQRSRRQPVIADQTTTDMLNTEFVDHSKKVIEDASNEGTILKTEEIDLSDLEFDNLYHSQALESCAPSRHNVIESTSASLSSKYDLDAEDRQKESEGLKLLSTTINKLENSLIKNAAISNSNEFDVFGQSVAAQLSNMPIEDALQLQVEIQQLITTKRISRLSRPHDNTSS